jgi:hypothetical protein
MSGVLDHSPADIIRYAMIDLALGILPPTASDWGIYVGQEPDNPDKVITCYNTAGLHQGRNMPGGEVRERHGIQVRVRAPNHTDGWVKANAIATTLDTSVAYTVVTISSTTYIIYAISRGATVLDLGKRVPTTKRDIFTLNITAALRKTS